MHESGFWVGNLEGLGLATSVRHSQYVFASSRYSFIAVRWGAIYGLEGCLDSFFSDIKARSCFFKVPFSFSFISSISRKLFLQDWNHAVVVRQVRASTVFGAE